MKINNIAKNTSYFTLALIIQKVITFAYFTILARNLAPEDLGKFYLAISLSSIFLVIIDIGQANLLTREISRLKEGDRKGAKDIIGQVMAFKLPLSVLAIASLVVLANLLDYPEITRNLIYISALIMSLDALSTSFFSVIRAFHNLKFESISSVATQLIILSIGIVGLNLGFGIIFLMFNMLLGSLFRFGFALSLIIFKWHLSIRPEYDFVKLKALFFLTVPFALYGIFNKLYLYLDTVLLSKLAGDYYVGLYQVAFKIIFALQFLPMAFIASLYPAFSAYWKKENTPPSPLSRGGEMGNTPPAPPDGGEAQSPSLMEKSVLFSLPSREGNKGCVKPASQLQITFERAFNYLTFISLPITIGIIAISDKIILLFTDKYLEAIPALNIIMLSTFFIFVNFVLGSLLNACDRQKENTRNMSIVLIFSVILNIILIPKYHALGAAITVTATNILMFTLSLLYAKKIVELRFKKIGWPFLKALISALVMGLAAIYLKSKTSLFLTIPASAAIYGSLLIILRAVKIEDLKSVTKSFIYK